MPTRQMQNKTNKQATDKEEKKKRSWCYMPVEENSTGLCPKVPWSLGGF